ncbi:MAG: hypothetical protein KBT14_00990 [Proteobacteria bacterium]|nr:hypothetical protein [Candidatus Enterousia onthequi]MCQ2581099.1 hypothetical protein [Alphaproteobacteria bacterium]
MIEYNHIGIWMTDMNEEQKMFKIGVCSLVGVVFLIVGLQVCYRTQHKALKFTYEETVKTQQQIALEQSRFESMTNSEYLLGMVTTVNPRVEIIGFRKYIEIEDLPLRK